MKPLSETLTELGIDCAFPIEIWDANGYQTYYEDSSGGWYKREYDANGNVTYHENYEDFWYKYERDTNGNETYFEDSDGYWHKREYNANGNQTYCEDSNGYWQKWERDANGDVDYYEDSTGVKKGTPKAAIILDEEESIRFAEMLEEEPSQPTPKMQRAIQAYRDFTPSGNISPKNPIGIPSSITNNQ